MTDSGLWQACEQTFQRLRGAGSGQDESPLTTIDTTTGVEVILRRKRGGRVFTLQELTTRRQEAPIWWVDRTSRGRVSGRRMLERALPPDLVGRIPRLLRLPDTATIYALRESARGPVAEFLTPHRPTDGRIQLSRCVREGAQPQRLTRRGVGTPEEYLDAERWWTLAGEGRLQEVSKRHLGNDATTFHAWPRKGNPDYILAGYGWTGLDSTALYLNPASRSGVTLEEARRRAGLR